MFRCRASLGDLVEWFEKDALGFVVCSALRRCVKVEVAVLGSSSLTVLMVSGCKATLEEVVCSELRGCVKVVAVLGSPSLIVRTVTVDVKQH